MFYPVVSLKLLKIENFLNRKRYYFNFDGNHIIEEKFFQTEFQIDSKINNFSLFNYPKNVVKNENEKEILPNEIINYGDLNAIKVKDNSNSKNEKLEDFKINSNLNLSDENCIDKKAKLINLGK